MLNLLYPINDSLQYLSYCRSSHWRSYLKRNILKIFKIRRITPASKSFFKKVACASGSLLNKVKGLRQTLVQVFTYEFCEIFKNTFFTEKLRVTASVIYKWFIILELKTFILRLSSSNFTERKTECSIISRFPAMPVYHTVFWRFTFYREKVLNLSAFWYCAGKEWVKTHLH